MFIAWLSVNRFLLGQENSLFEKVILQQNLRSLFQDLQLLD